MDLLIDGIKAPHYAHNSTVKAVKAKLYENSIMMSINTFSHPQTKWDTDDWIKAKADSSSFGRYNLCFFCFRFWI